MPFIFINGTIKYSSKLETYKNPLFLLEPCGPGSYSDDGLASCKLCEIGSYQDGYEGKSCHRCPGITTTSDKGASSLAQCRSESISIHFEYFYKQYKLCFKPLSI